MAGKSEGRGGEGERRERKGRRRGGRIDIQSMRVGKERELHDAGDEGEQKLDRVYKSGGRGRRGTRERVGAIPCARLL